MGAEPEQEFGEYEREVEPDADCERAIEACRRVVMTMRVAVVVLVMIVRMGHLVARLVSGAAARWAIYHSLPFRDAPDRSCARHRAHRHRAWRASPCLCRRAAGRHRDRASTRRRCPAPSWWRRLDESRR